MKNHNDRWTFSKITQDIEVIVAPEFHTEGSKKELNNFLWSYNVQIRNLSAITIQIIGRHWQIFDSNGKITVVKGEGVVGEQPIIKPDEFFEYASQVRLFTSSGLMQGEYYAIDVISQEAITISIPAFSLDHTEGPLFIN